MFGFGVILWELMTESIPWNNLNSLQVLSLFLSEHMCTYNLDALWFLNLIENCLFLLEGCWSCRVYG